MSSLPQVDEGSATGRTHSDVEAAHLQLVVHDDQPGTSDAQPGESSDASEAPTILDIEDLSVYYGSTLAVRDVSLAIPDRTITAIIGPSGCGKSTVIRCMNRMNDLIPEAKVVGRVSYHGVDIYDSAVDPVEVRRRIGMVFQKPNPFPKSIYDNVAYGLRVSGRLGRHRKIGFKSRKHGLDDRIEIALRKAALWDEVKDRLEDHAYGLSGGQQQRLCIARALATEPDMLLMDEPCSALDPVATAHIEDLMQQIKNDYSIVIVTHNMQQAARVSDRTAFFTTEANESSSRRAGVLVEYDDTAVIFSTPSDERTENYVTGRFG